MNLNIDNLKNNLVCIEYPGLVVNEENMLRTVGGINKISEIFCNDKSRLEVNFHPDNIYSKPTYASPVSLSGILLKITVRKPKNRNSEDLPKVKTVEFLGRVTKVYQFSVPCDFQYVPILKLPKEPTAMCVYNECLPNGIVSDEWLNEPTKNIKFFPPVAFTRVDNFTAMNFFKHNLETASEKTTLKSSNHGVFWQFSLTAKIPNEPNPLAVTAMKTKFLLGEPYETILQLFEKRPMWTKLAIHYETKFTNEKLKYLLPSIAYYNATGPWRATWTKFDYDPRKNFDSRCYQCFDYRLRTWYGLKTLVSAKRGPTKIAKSNIPQSHTISSPFIEADFIPTARQCFYQYCDIHVTKIQEMLDKIPTPMSGAVCNEKSGWLPMGFDEQCREILNNIIKDNVAARQSGENLPTQYDLGSDVDDDYDDENVNFVDDDDDDNDDDDDDVANDDAEENDVDEHTGNVDEDEDEEAFLHGAVQIEKLDLDIK